VAIVCLEGLGSVTDKHAVAKERSPGCLNDDWPFNSRPSPRLIGAPGPAIWIHPYPMPGIVRPPRLVCHFRHPNLAIRRIRLPCAIRIEISRNKGDVLGNLVRSEARCCPALRLIAVGAPVVETVCSRKRPGVVLGFRVIKHEIITTFQCRIAVCTLYGGSTIADPNLNTLGGSHANKSRTCGFDGDKWRIQLIE